MDKQRLNGDYDFVAWLEVVKGIKCSSFRKIKRGLVEWTYDMTEESLDSLRAEYVNSQFPMFLLIMKLKKDLGF